MSNDGGPWRISAQGNGDVLVKVDTTKLEDTTAYLLFNPEQERAKADARKAA